MVKVVLAAILFLAPHVSHQKARSYAHRIVQEAERRDVPPLVVVAIIHHETGGTWRTKLKSRTNDYGLMQVHVSLTTHRRYLGREKLLYNPDVNIYWGARFLQMVKRWHAKRCVGSHPWWAHYNWGFRILSDRKYVRKVRKILAHLDRKTKPVLVVSTPGATSSAKAAPVAVATETSGSSVAMASERHWTIFGLLPPILPSGGTRGAARFLAECTRTRKRCGSTTQRTVRTTERRMNDRLQAAR